MELVFDLVGFIVHAFFGACVGVVWPASTPAWARLQKLGFVLGLIFVVGFTSVGLLEGGQVWERFEGPVFVVSCLAFVVYLIVGNACRKFHEGK